MTATGDARVVVGVDGSQSALAAVRVAAAQAERQGRWLLIVHAFIWPTLRIGTDPLSPPGPDLGLRPQAERLLAEATDEAHKIAPELPVATELIDGAAAPVLIRACYGAALLVLGDRGLGAVSGLLIGSVAVQVAAHAPCPVLVVRGTPRANGPVVVGVDGSAGSARALGFAFTEAALRDSPLVALHAWRTPATACAGDMMPLVYDPARQESEGRRVLSAALRGWTERYPRVVVQLEVVHGRAGQHLVELSRGAQLVVVGSRGRGGFGGLLLGSVSQHLLYHADCPIAVVRNTARG